MPGIDVSKATLGYARLEQDGHQLLEEGTVPNDPTGTPNRAYPCELALGTRELK